MKTTIVLIALLLSTACLGAESNQNSCTPAPAKKVVHHHYKAKPAPKCESKTVIVEKTVVVEKTVEKRVYLQRSQRKNRIRLLGGIGPTGNSLDTTPTQVTLSKQYGPVVGLGYSRLVTERVSVELNVLSNQTGLVGLGYDF